MLGGLDKAEIPRDSLEPIPSNPFLIASQVLGGLDKAEVTALEAADDRVGFLYAAPPISSLPPAPPISAASRPPAPSHRHSPSVVLSVLCRYALVLGHVLERRRRGGLASEAPVFSRVPQAFSEGMLGFGQARKTEDTPFPFPYAQILSFMLYAFAILFPLVTASKVGLDLPRAFDGLP